jgi:hypothetical protein
VVFGLACTSGGTHLTRWDQVLRVCRVRLTLIHKVLPLVCSCYTIWYSLLMIHVHIIHMHVCYSEIGLIRCPRFTIFECYVFSWESVYRWNYLCCIWLYSICPIYDRKRDFCFFCVSGVVGILFNYWSILIDHHCRRHFPRTFLIRGLVCPMYCHLVRFS